MERKNLPFTPTEFFISGHIRAHMYFTLCIHGKDMKLDENKPTAIPRWSRPTSNTQPPSFSLSIHRFHAVCAVQTLCIECCMSFFSLLLLFEISTAFCTGRRSCLMQWPKIMFHLKVNSVALVYRALKVCIFTCKCFSAK